MDSTPTVFQRICNRIGNRKLASCHNYRNRNILQHKRQHRRRIGQRIGTMNHHNPMIIITSSCDECCKSGPVFRSDIGTVKWAEILCFQLQIFGNHTQFLQHIATAHSRNKPLGALYRRKRPSCIYDQDSLWHIWTSIICHILTNCIISPARFPASIRPDLW